MRHIESLAVPTWIRLARLFQKGDRQLVAHLREHNLTLAQFDVLAQVGSMEGLTQQELADKLLVTKGNISQLVERMCDAGLLERRACGRPNRLYLTPRGWEIRCHVLPDQDERITKIFSVLTSEELNQLSKLLRKVDRALT